MSGKGNCLDNAAAESFFSSRKKERIKKHIYRTRELAIADVVDYIDYFCNQTRRHSHLGGMSPDQFEATLNPLKPANSTPSLLGFVPVAALCIPLKQLQDRFQ